MAQCKVTDEAFVTLATNDVYCRGALVLAESLKKYGTTRQLMIMITPQVTADTRRALEEVFDVINCVDVLDSRDAAHLALLKRPELGITFTKIHCWTFTEYKKCIFMDADMLALQNIDELFEREELSAAPDSGWPDLFNSGLFVFTPSLKTFNELLLLAGKEGSFDGGDQGLLNTYFNTWATGDISHHLPFLYNLHVSASYTYLPAFTKFGKLTKVVHFLGAVKPWHHIYNRVTGGVQQIAGPSQLGVKHYPEFLKEWWALYNDKVQKFFSKEQEMVAVEKEGNQFLSTASGVDVSELALQSTDRSHGMVESGKDPQDQNQDENIHENHQSHSDSTVHYQEQHHHFLSSSDSSDPPYSFPISFNRIQPNVDIQDQFHDNSNVQHNPPGNDNLSEPYSSEETPQSQSLDSYTPSSVTISESLHDLERILPDVDDTESTPLDDTPKLCTPSSVDLSDPFFSENEENGAAAMSEENSLANIRFIPAAILPMSNEAQNGGAMDSEELRKERVRHMQDWERGNIDYMGRDSFANIQAALDKFLE